MRRQIVVGLALALGIGVLASTQASAYRAYRAYGTYLPRALRLRVLPAESVRLLLPPAVLWSLSRRAVGLAGPWMALPRV